MSQLKDQLIRLGNQNPELRGHLRPILATLEKDSSFDHGYLVDYGIYWSGSVRGRDYIDKKVAYETLDDVIDEYALKRSWFDAGSSKRIGYFSVSGKERLSGRRRKEYQLSVKRSDGQDMSMEEMQYLADAFKPQFF